MNEQCETEETDQPYRGKAMNSYADMIHRHPQLREGGYGDDE